METTKYVSRHTGEEIDSLLDKVKEGLVEPDLKTQVNNNTTAIAKEVTDRKEAVENLNTTLTAELNNKVSKVSGKDLSSNDYTDSDKAEVAKVKDKADQMALDETNKNVEGINVAIERLVPKEDVNTDSFDPTSDNPASQKSTADYFSEFKKLYYAEAGIGKYAGMIIPQYENEYAFDDLTNYTNIDMMFDNCTFAGGGKFKIPDFSNDIIAASHLFSYLKGRNLDNTEDESFKLYLGNLNIANGYWTFYGMKNCTDIFIQVGKKVTFHGYAMLTFANSHELESIGAIDVSSVKQLDGIFTGCESLKHIHCTHFKVSFDISPSTAFEQSDLVEIISNLDTVSTFQTLTMGATNLAKLTDEEKAVATIKNWVLA